MTDLSRPQFEGVWATEGEPFTPGQAWLDLLQSASPDGILPVVSYTERWGWKNQEVADFFVALGRHGHLRPHDKSRWRLAYQAQGHTLEADYEDVWKIYPRKVAKQKGYHAYAATRKGRNGDPPVPARILFEATQRYAFARQHEDAEFILHAGTFFGPDERWKEKHKPKTNSKAKREKGWSRPTSRDLTKDIPPTGTAKSRGRKKRTPDQGKKPKPTPKNPRKKSPRKKSPKDDPLGSL